jgi:hypothetical protein
MAQAATHHEAHTRDLVPTMPGMGQILRLVRRDDIPAMARFPRGPDVVSDGRLLTCAKASAGKRWGTAGHTIGNGHLPWAFSEAAVLGLRAHPAGQTSVARVEQTPGQGNAVTILAHTLARAVSDRLTRHTACEMDTGLHGSGSRASAPDAAGDPPVASGLEVLLDGVSARQGTPRLVIPEPWALMGHPLGRLQTRRSSRQGTWAAPLPSLRLTGTPHRRRHTCE